MIPSKKPWLRLRMLLLMMAMLTAMTWWIGTQVNRYTAQTSAVPSDFPGDISQWKFRENWKKIDRLEGFSTLSSGIQITRERNGISTAELRVPLPQQKPAGAKLLASAELSTDSISGGVENWHGLLFTIWFYDADGVQIKKTARTVQALRGDTAPLRYSREIELPDQAVEAGIGLRVFESTGTAVMRVPRVQVVAPWDGYRNVMLAVFAVWALYGLVVIIALASQGQLLYAVVPIAMIAIIAIGVSLPNHELLRITRPLEQMTNALIPNFRDLGLYSFNKVGHAITFALLALFACTVRKPMGATWIGVICFLVLLAILSEGVQLFFVGRSTRLIDMAIDLSGASAGAALFFVLWLVSSPFRRGNQPDHS